MGTFEQNESEPSTKGIDREDAPVFPSGCIHQSVCGRFSDLDLARIP
jgi:hypothetical protein